jgi:hypothetical protein
MGNGGIDARLSSFTRVSQRVQHNRDYRTLCGASFTRVSRNGGGGKKGSRTIRFPIRRPPPPPLDILAIHYTYIYLNEPKHPHGQIEPHLRGRSVVFEGDWLG